MKKVSRIIKVTIVTILVGVMLLSGCKGRSDYSNSTEQINTTIDNGKINIEIDQTNHVFVITSDSLGRDFRQEGKILTYSYPETANVYKVYPFDESQSSFSNPIKEWKVASIQTVTLVEGQKNDEKDDNLSRAERIVLVDSLSRINTSQFKQMDIIKTGYSDAAFGEYVLKYTYPATKKDLYKIKHFDLKLNYDIVLDDVKDRPLNYYVIRRTIDGITVGLPENAIDQSYEHYDSKTKKLKGIYSESLKSFFDGDCLYEVHNNANAKPGDIELYLKDQPVLSLEQAMKKAASNINNALSYSNRIGGVASVYAVELVYLTVCTSDFSDGRYENASMYSVDTENAYMYPFWAFYVLDNFVVGSNDVAQRNPILVNAITGEVIVCN